MRGSRKPAIIATAVAAALAIAACSSSSSSSTSASSSSSGSSAKITLTWWNNGNTQPLLGVWQSVVAQFHAAHPNVTISMDPSHDRHPAPVHARHPGRAGGRRDRGRRHPDPVLPADPVAAVPARPDHGRDPGLRHQLERLPAAAGRVQQPGLLHLPLAVANFQSTYTQDTARVYAFTAVSMIPALAIFIFAQRKLVGGLVGAIRG